MQEAIYHPPSFRLRRVYARLRSKAFAKPLIFADVLQHTLAVFVKQPVTLLTCALVCFASGALLGTLIYALWNLVVFVRNDNYFTAVPTALAAQWFVQAAIGAFTFLVGRGAVTWITLRTAADQPISLGAAFQAALRKWRPLLVSSVIYGALITVGLAGLTWLLRELRMDTSNFRWMRNDPNSVLNMVVVRALGALPPEPGSPLSELYAQVRFGLSRQGGAAYVVSTAQAPWHGLPPVLVLTGITSALLLVLTETMLCMRNAIIMCAHDDAATGWLRATLVLAGQQFGRVLCWRWASRLIIVALLTTFVVLPTSFQQGVGVSLMIRTVRAYWPYALNTAVYSLAAALVGAVVFAFNTVFDAQMLLTLNATRGTNKDV